jgi:hypothetical protein
MNIQEVISFENEINIKEASLEKSTDNFEKFYGEDVTVTQDDGSTLVGKEACRKSEEEFIGNIVSITASDLLSSVAMPSPDPDYEFLVIATWYYDLVTNMYPIKGNQTSFAYWKDGLIRKTVYKSGSEIIA